MPASITALVHRRLTAAFDGHGTIVLAVSGGLDSMVLLEASSRTIDRQRLIVATFDHGTGPVATTAASLVQKRARELGVQIVVGRTSSVVGRPAEETWRAARWAFLRDTARSACEAIATAHTRDDQVETVLMRLMRGAGARGLAGLLADSDVLRPLLDLRREQLLRYAREAGVEWIEDPTNQSRAFFRNRVRHDILPALRRVRPAIDRDLLAIARRAAAWRAETERVVDRDCPTEVISVGDDRVVDVSAACLRGAEPRALGVVWPVLAAKARLALDRRGIERLVSFTVSGRVGSRIQVSGGWQVTRSRDAFRLHRPRPCPLPPSRLDSAVPLHWGAWSFRPASNTDQRNVWMAWLPTDRPLVVRAWEAGDTMAVRAGGTPRKVKRLLSAAGVTGDDRRGWPVVMAGDRIVWIPGVRLSSAATERAGEPALPFVCEPVLPRPRRG